MLTREFFAPIYRPVTRRFRNIKKQCRIWIDICRVDLELKKTYGSGRVLYFGITAHSNLGDMAQHYCICQWIKDNYPDKKLIMVESDTIVSYGHVFICILKKYIYKNDIIIFQSGYTTQDLGGNHDEMHRLICDNFPEVRILMMPQTIFFKKKENEERTARSYNSAHNMLFLARDSFSFEKAKCMFPDIRVIAFPDIVTSLIGTFHFNSERKGVCLCVRADGEKYYSDDELSNLKRKLEGITIVNKTDTKVRLSYRKLRNEKKKYIEAAITEFSKYKVTITDRYHGTIFSLAAGTPVIVIKTTDHKVTSGVDWFKGIYDEYIYVASNLGDAYKRCIDLLNNHSLSYKMSPFFAQNYYIHLKELFESNVSSQ